MVLEPDGHNVILTHDFDHVFKNVRNNWFTEKTKELTFTSDGRELLACWKDIESLYNEDCQMALRLTKLNYTSVNPKPLQRQNIQLVVNVFNDKTVAGLISLQDKMNYSEGTAIFIKLITDWYKMMSVNSKYDHSRLNDNLRLPWTPECDSFNKLMSVCEIISSCQCKTQKELLKQLTDCTAKALIYTTLIILQLKGSRVIMISNML